MKRLWLTLLMMIVGVSNVLATHYEIGPGDYRGDLGLIDYDTLHMTGGTIEGLTLAGHSIANIENTSPLGNITGDGGIWEISLSSYSTLNFSGGEINDIESGLEAVINMTGGLANSIEMHSQSMSFLSGGQIGTLASDQISIPQEPGVPGPQGWIQFYCLEYNYDSGANLLTGLWEDNSSFNINLLNIGAVPTYDHIEFHIVPEPATLLLFAAGSMFLRKRY